MDPMTYDMILIRTMRFIEVLGQPGAVVTPAMVRELAWHIHELARLAKG